MLPRLWLLVGSKGPTDRQTMSLIELSWTAKKMIKTRTTTDLDTNLVCKKVSTSLRSSHCSSNEIAYSSHLQDFFVVFWLHLVVFWLNLVKFWLYLVGFWLYLVEFWLYLVVLWLYFVAFWWQFGVGVIKILTPRTYTPKHHSQTSSKGAGNLCRHSSLHYFIVSESKWNHD